MQWNPLSRTEFATVGQDNHLCFWSLDSAPKRGGAKLTCYQADIPSQLHARHRTTDFTALAFAADNTLVAALCQSDDQL